MFGGGLLFLASLGIRVETNTGSILDRHSDSWATYERAVELFGGDEFVTVLVSGDGPYSAAVLEHVRSLTSALEAIPGIRRVDSVSSVPAVRASFEGDLSLDAAVPRTGPIDVRAVADRLESDRIAPNALVSADAEHYALNVYLESGFEERYSEILAGIREMAGAGAQISGVPLFRVESDDRMRKELLVFVPASVALLGVCLYLLLGSLRAMAIPIVVSAVATVATLGLMAATGTAVTITTVVLPPIMLALGCAYCMHLVIACPEGEHAVRRAALPVALSGLTTALGFLAISTVRIDAVSQLATFGAFGVLVLVAGALTLCPALVSLSGVSLRSTFLAERISRLGALVVRAMHSGRARWAVISSWGVLAAVFCAGATALAIETDVIEWLPANDPIRKDYESIRARMSGISPLSVLIESEAELSIADPAVLTAIDGLSSYLEEFEWVGKVVSIRDPLRQLMGGMVGDSSQPLPASRAETEQLLLVLEAEPYMADLVAPDRSAAMVHMRLDDNSSARLLSTAEMADAWWRENGPAGVSAVTTGVMFEFARAEDAIAYGQLTGLAFAVGSIAIVLFFSLSSARYALVALAPNAVPVLAIFGVMGFFAIPLDASTVVLSGLALGIAVDDTVHLAVGYLEDRHQGHAPQASMERTMSRTVRPVVFTTVCVSAGFGVLCLSGFVPVANLGVLTAAVMVLCLCADLTLLPALLLEMDAHKA